MNVLLPQASRNFFYFLFYVSSYSFFSSVLRTRTYVVHLTPPSLTVRSYVLRLTHSLTPPSLFPPAVIRSL